ncbi:MAG: hypothetical protein ACREPQ_07945 [Rhodanobacter sp.]
MRHAWIIAATILAAGLLTTTLAGATSEAHPDTTFAWRTGAIETLATMPDADALVTAAGLARSLPDGASRSLSLLDRAAALAPKAADIGLLDVAQCSTQPGCDVLSREARVRGIDPQNGDAWMAALHNASEHSDQARIDDALSNMAHSTYFNFYFASLGRRFINGLNRVPLPLGGPADHADTPEAQRQVQAMGMVAALAIPAMQDLVHACKPGSSASESRRETCRAIATSMERGDTLIANMVGLRLHEWSTRDAADRAEALVQRRRLQWRMHQLHTITGTPALPPTKQVTTMLAHEREADSIDAMLADAGRPLEPPADWQPPQPQSAHAPACS